MELLTSQEELTYLFCQQVLQVHSTVQHMPLIAVLSGCVVVLAQACVQLSATGRDPWRVIESSTDWLIQHVRARGETPPLGGFVDVAPDDPEDPAVGAQGEEFRQVLTELLTDVGIRHQLSAESLWRVLLALTADVLSMLLHQGGQDLDEVNTVIEVYVRPALIQALTTHRDPPE